ncbi:hypothetical protein [Dendrolimus punctatus cypovirus 22]|uniref:hypothetical protein n=1 Tax=Dendrolimus punctatus cypovirus 22 TaxID=1577776 RepID=UPI00054000F3|nr:hypothetical protein [Dendrolimus punctatus cypovirus 22]AIY60606.1 hypothetical protein [Dendrolimus punctatus cypovirus 22]
MNFFHAFTNTGIRNLTLMTHRLLNASDEFSNQLKLHPFLMTVIKNEHLSEEVKTEKLKRGLGLMILAQTVATYDWLRDENNTTFEDTMHLRRDYGLGIDMSAFDGLLGQGQQILRPRIPTRSQYAMLSESQFCPIPTAISFERHRSDHTYYTGDIHTIQHNLFSNASDKRYVAQSHIENNVPCDRRTALSALSIVVAQARLDCSSTAKLSAALSHDFSEHVIHSSCDLQNIDISVKFETLLIRPRRYEFCIYLSDNTSLVLSTRSNCICHSLPHEMLVELFKIPLFYTTWREYYERLHYGSHCRRSYTPWSETVSKPRHQIREDVVDKLLEDVGYITRVPRDRQNIMRRARLIVYGDDAVDIIRHDVD